MWDRCPCRHSGGAEGVLGPAAAPDSPVVPGERDAGKGSTSTSAPGLCGSPGPAAGAPVVHRAPHRAPSPGASPSSLPGSPRSGRWALAGVTPSPSPHGRQQQHKEPWRCMVPHWATLPAQEVRTGPQLPPPPPLCKLFAKAFISVATPPCTRVSVATPSRHAGPSDASRRAAHVLHRPLRKAPLCPRFGGFLFSPSIPSHPIPGHYVFTKALSCARSLPLRPGPTPMPQGMAQEGGTGSSTPNC